MKRKIFDIILIILAITFFALPSLADKISAPPPLKDEPPAEQHYLKEIYDNFHNLEIVTSSPDGSKKGKKGQVILYNNSGTYTLWCNVDNSTDWQQL